jgi:hypothetical protein
VTVLHLQAEMFYQSPGTSLVTIFVTIWIGLNWINIIARKQKSRVNHVIYAALLLLDTFL